MRPILRPTFVGLTATLIFKTARLLHAGPAVVSRVKSEMISTAPMKKTTLPQGAPHSAICRVPFEFRNERAQIRDTLHREARGARPRPRYRDSPVPLSQRSTVRPHRQADGESPRGMGKIRPLARTRKNLEALGRKLRIILESFGDYLSKAFVPRCARRGGVRVEIMSTGSERAVEVRNGCAP